MDLLKIAQMVLSNQAVRAVVSQGFEVRDAALRVQSSLMESLNLPTASDLATLAGRMRSMSTRLELLEDSIGRVERGVAQLNVGAGASPETTRSNPVS